MPHGWQILERPSEFSEVRSALTGAGSYGVVLVGAAGVGKTTLARSVTESLRSQVHWVASTESSRSIPLGVFAHLVGPSTSRDATALLASARESLVSQGNSIVGVDDAHLLDELSATLLHQIAVDQTGRILATVRTGEPVPDAVTSLWKDGYLRRIELQPFTKKQSVGLVESVIGGRLEGLSADLMWKSSGGNPLFLRHLVEGSIDAGTLRKVDDVWQLRGPTAVPSGLVELLESRLEQSGEDVLGVLKILALCEPLDIDALTELAGDAAVDAAEMRGLIRFQQDGPTLNARFSHPLVGDVVRSKIGRAAERRLKGQVVQILRRRGLDTPASRIRMAQLSIDSDQSVDNELLTTAAKDAIYLSNLPLGERLARTAFDRTGSLQAGALLSRALLWQGKPAAADDILAKFAPDELDELQLVQWAIPRLSTLFWSMGEVEKAWKILELANERVRHPSLALVLDATAAALTVHQNEIGEGIDKALTVLADPQAPDQAVEFAAFAAGLAMPVAGSGDEFEPIAARCRAEQKTTDGMIRVMVRYCDVLALTHTGQLDLAAKRAADYADFSSVGQFLAWAIAKIMAGVVATARGDFPEVVSSIEQALAALSAESPLPWQLPGRLLLARAYAALGRVGEAERVLNDAAAHSGPSMALHEPQRLISKAWYAAAKGMERRAVELARAAADNARHSGQFALEAEALHHATRFGDRTTAARLAELTGVVHGSPAPLFARHAAAFAASDAAGLDAVSVDFEHAGLLLSAADAAAQAAHLHDAAGDRRKTNESGANALRLADLCGGATTPAVKTAARPLPLTSREREVAELVAAGLTNREIAEQLTLSVRTVEGHVYRACFKLDVADRDELAKLIKKKS
ncbi:response regulator containing a CheY-like receiver domain and an HTH DNA-binding domain [Mycolicibacterium chubuense NBB4]|uniref:Response regulator containing a CheY-like receiver domain and an HTH DNA-binding domain n=1 Tax=Mycolicibacterium chubuense (strain NBB4) TaxID=710421 RepID=I4BLS7_MYCCN|nr:LuxR family transcriptional regulator [Mycolicibacterium chubuense]AFM18234.1 response regulator containing a CheY-like receiver domain and an HTH DNA-binding domain [Mycolicibacterium chubuense NBB4]